MNLYKVRGSSLLGRCAAQVAFYQPPLQRIDWPLFDGNHRTAEMLE